MKGLNGARLLTAEDMPKPEMKVTQITLVVTADEKNLSIEEMREVRNAIRLVRWGEIAESAVPDSLRELLSIEVRQL
jgi:DNA-directed RNA polymerase beta' subunit